MKPNKKNNELIEKEIAMDIEPETIQLDELTELMPIEKIAKNIKQEHGLKEVFITDVAGQTFIWRKIKRSEFKNITSVNLSENEDLAYYERQDYIAKTVILYPENAEELLEEFGGISDIIASEAMVKSGFGYSTTVSV